MKFFLALTAIAASNLEATSPPSEIRLHCEMENAYFSKSEWTKSKSWTIVTSEKNNKVSIPEYSITGLSDSEYSMMNPSYVKFSHDNIYICIFKKCGADDLVEINRNTGDLYFQYNRDSINYYKRGKCNLSKVPPRFRGQRLTGDSPVDSRLPFGGGVGRTDWGIGRGMGDHRRAAAA